MTRHRVGITVAAWAALLAAGPASRGENYAIVIGVNDCPAFRLPDGSRPKSLGGAEVDADAVASRLVERFGFARPQVRLLKGPQATLAAVRQALGDVARRARPSDHVVFHFSGHGTQVADRRPFDEADGRDEALCLADADASGENVLVDDELGLWLDDLQAASATVVLDCCHAGSGTKDADDDVVARFLPMPLPRPQPTQAPKAAWRELAGGSKSLGRRTTALFACQAQQQAYERRLPAAGSPARAGQFTYFLLEGLEGLKADADADGTVSVREAFDYTRRRLDETFNRHRAEPADRQEPQLESDADAAAVFTPGGR